MQKVFKSDVASPEVLGLVLCKIVLRQFVRMWLVEPVFCAAPFSGEGEINLNRLDVDFLFAVGKGILEEVGPEHLIHRIREII